MKNENGEQTFKVMFGENKIIGGVMFGKGVYDLTAERAAACVREGGVMSPEDADALQKTLESSPVEGAPLSLEETMERFAKFDFSDDVMRSMQYHQAEIQRKNSPSVPATYGDKTLTEESTVEVGGGKTEGADAGKSCKPVSGPTAGAGEAGEGGGNASGAGEAGGAGAMNPPDGFNLPSDFPARKELIAGGVTSLEKLRGMKRAEILDLADIGEAKANQIGARLAAMAEENQ